MIRCVILVDVAPGFEKGPNHRGLCHHTIGFGMAAHPDDHVALAAHLRELADMLTAPTLPPDPNL